MPTSTITVYNSSSGRPEPNARGVLEWNGIANLSQSRPVHTDSNGMAIIDHASSGQATVYINGREVGRMSAPGEKKFSV